MNIKGWCTIKQATTTTRDLFDDLHLLHGKRFDVLDRNDTGDCLIYVPAEATPVGEHLLDIDSCDVEKFEPAPLEANPFAALLAMITSMKRK